MIGSQFRKIQAYPTFPIWSVPQGHQILMRELPHSSVFHVIYDQKMRRITVSPFGNAQWLERGINHWRVLRTPASWGKRAPPHVVWRGITPESEPAVDPADNSGIQRNMLNWVRNSKNQPEKLQVRWHWFFNRKICKRKKRIRGGIYKWDVKSIKKILKQQD